MSDSLFLQIHSLSSYPGTLLNRDDAGFAKRLPFGGATRTRVSSQCLKRHWRTFTGANSLDEIGEPASLRSRYTFELRIARPLIEAGLPEPVVRQVVEQLMDQVLGSNTSRKEGGELKTGQITVLGEPEVDYLREVAEQVIEAMRGEEGNEDLFALEVAEEELDKKTAKALEKATKDALKATFDRDLKANLKGLELAAGLDAALFGRMVTSDLLARGDAAIHVAHAITVHEEESESDYFSAIDDLLGELAGGDEEQRGSGHINSAELTSGLFYGYVVVDVPLLVSNLTGVPRGEWRSADHTLAREVIERLIHIIATVSPGAKLGSTAPYSHAQCVMVEAGRVQPRTLANAFQRPVAPRPDLLANTYGALAQFWADHAQMYGAQTRVALSAMGDAGELAEALGVERQPLGETASWAAAQIGGEA